VSRIESGKRRAGGAKRALAVVAAAGLVVAGVLARATNSGHPARASGTSVASASSSGSGSKSESSNDFSIAPSSSQPQVQTHVS
jgi:hypothetical protein